MGPRISPEAPTQAMGLLATGAFGHYYERWELLPNNSLRVECAIPISNLTILAGDEVAKSAEFSDAFRTAATSPDTRAKFLDTYGAAHSGDLTRICGWKITNDSEREAWKALDGGDYARAAQLFQSAAQAEPTRPFACLGEAWARVGTKEFDLARKALQAGRGRLNDETRPWFMKFVFFVKDQIDSAETEAAGPEVDFLAISDVIGTSNPSVDLAVVNPQALKNKRASEWSAADLDLANKAVAAYPYWALIDKANGMRGRSAVQPVGQSAFSVQRMAAMKVPNFLSLQVAAKTVVLRGHVYRANRDYPNAITQYALAVRLGQISGHGTLIAHLIGVAMEDIGLKAIVQSFEDGLVADAQTFQVLSKAVEALDRGEVRLEPGEAFTYEGGTVPFTSDPATQATLEAIAVPNFLEAETRLQVVQTRLALVKAACAVKAKSLKPPFPATMDAAVLPPDIFASGQPLRYRAAGNEAVLYSLGPNKQDDGGTLTYDPTNGTISAGDVILTIR